MNRNLNLKTQVKLILKVVQNLAPGRSVELRIPPHAAIQCVSGSIHRRGTPPNVVEMSAETLLKLLENPVKWQQFCDSGAISASGTNSNLSNLFVEVSKLIYSEAGSENGK
jgi:Bacterial SCP ortholog